MKTLSKEAWKNLKEKQNAFKEREYIYANHLYGDSIVLKEARSIEAFLPKLWYEVSEASGSIPGFDSVFVVGYNTPILGDDGSFQRSLAIYGYRDGKYKLIKQTLHAIDSFDDTDNDLIFDSYGETNFSLSIDEKGHVLVNYEFMRGEAVNEYAYENGRWVLVYYSSSHRTCCNADIASYDYKTKTVTETTILLIDEDDVSSSDLPRDTVITYIEDRPIIYMDSP